MVVGNRLRLLREQKKMSQGDIEERTGLFRCYISRVENGHTMPSLGTLEKFARGLEVPLYQLLYDGREPPKVPPGLKLNGASKTVWGSSGKEAGMLTKFRRLFSHMEEEDRRLLLYIAQKMHKAATL